MKDLNPSEYRPSSSDPIHLNLKGSILIARILSEYILQNTNLIIHKTNSFK